jgi:sodium/hydrogen antiporter
VSFIAWMSATGALLLLMALSSAYVRRLPISTSIIYLALGVALGPAWGRILAVDITQASGWIERATEIAVIVSLFVGGLKLRLPFSDPAWTASRRLAAPTMLVTILAVGLIAHLALGIDAPTALLLGAILAPTDPVLASAVSVEDAADHDRLRYALSGEAGLNDGMAFPFVILALEWHTYQTAGGWVVAWFLREIIWAIPAALALGYYLGKWVGRLAILLRSRQRDTSAPSDFLALALIALSYVGAEMVHAWGFLAVFAAGIGLRHAEVRVVRESPHPAHARPSLWRRFGFGRGSAARPASHSSLESQSPRALAHAASATTVEAPNVGVSVSSAIDHPPAEHLVRAPIDSDTLEEPSVAAGVLVAEALSFGATLERLLEVLMVVLVGVALHSAWDTRAIGIALALFVVIRPLAAQLLLSGTPTSRPQRWLMGWFGVRGIGSVYYVSYALQHGVSADQATFLVSMTISVIALSIVLHGTSAQPLLSRYERMLARE